MANKRKPPRMGPHLKSALWVQEIIKHHGMSVGKFAEMVDMSLGGVNKLLYGQQRPRWDSLEKLKAVAPPFLKDYDDWQKADHVPRPADGPERGVFVVRSKDSVIVGEELDSILDLGLRRRARNAALTAIDSVVSSPTPPKNNGD